MRQMLAAIALGAGALISVNAFAVPANGQFDGAGLGNNTFTGANLIVATALNFDQTAFPNGDALVTGLNANYLGNPNDFATNGDPTGLQQVDIVSSLDLTQAVQNVPNFIQFGSTFQFNFDMTGLNILSRTAGSIAIELTGNFDDTSGTYDSDTAANLILTANSTGAPNMSYSFSFGTPPIPTPAPGAIALLGLGLVGLRAFHRKAA